jgi:hypothetical protein
VTHFKWYYEEDVENLLGKKFILQVKISMEETQTLCTEEIEIKTDNEVASCFPEGDEKQYIK